jgi:hypothetical protein
VFRGRFSGSVFPWQVFRGRFSVADAEPGWLEDSLEGWLGVFGWEDSGAIDVAG